MAIQKKIKFKKPYFENLDALRFLAAFSVFIFHFFSEATALFDIDTSNSGYKLVNLLVSKGTLGVNFFFVLSGFLITYLILWERQQTKDFNIKHFLIRRTLRIWPLYFLIVFIGFVLFPAIFNGYETNHSLWHYMLFLANFDEIKVGLTDPINFLTAPWSVAVEEQFYIIWGLLLFALHRLKMFKLWTVLVLTLLFSLVFSFINYNDVRILYYHTFSVMSNIVIGSALALAYFQKKTWLIKLKNLNRWAIVLIYAMGFTMILAKNKIFAGPFAAIEQVGVSIFFAFIIFDQVYLKNSILKVGTLKGFNHLGKMSYGLYLFHLVVIFVCIQLLEETLLKFQATSGILVLLLLSIAGTYLLSYLSFKYFETPFLSLKKRFS